MARIRSAAGNLLLALAALGVALLAAEGAARLLFEAPWTDRLLDFQEEVQRGPYARNGLGLRGPEPTRPKPPGLRRVLVLGDSFTFGLGVDDDADLFPARLERALGDVGPPVEVVNGGIPGSLTGDWLALWRRVGAELEPDAVLAVFFLRDGTRLETIPAFFARIRERVARETLGSPLYRHSRLYRLLRDRLDRRELARIYTEGLVLAYTGDDGQTAEWRRARENLVALRDAVEAAGARFGLAIFPVLVELRPGAYPFAAVTHRIEEFAREAGISCHDMLPAFLGERAPELWVSALDQHPNARGHALAAASLEPFVRELLAPERPGD